MIVGIDYFTKWVEARPLATIMEANYTNFIYKDIICWYGVPRSIVIDNAKQFNYPKLIEICKRMKIKKAYSTPYHLQANGQVEVANKPIKDNLKKKLQKIKGAWVDELSLVLWVHHMTTKTS